jgi:hypothetical protein
MIKNKLTKEEARALKNEDLIRRMREGESLTSFSIEASCFPKRPVIKKDKKLVEKLFGEDDTNVHG